jgi:hypothetical protein
MSKKLERQAVRPSDPTYTRRVNSRSSAARTSGLAWSYDLLKSKPTVWWYDSSGKPYDEVQFEAAIEPLYEHVYE